MDGRLTTKRGCAVIQSTQHDTCEVAYASPTNYDNCTLCNKDDCNQAGAITGSIFILFVTSIVFIF